MTFAFKSKQHIKQSKVFEHAFRNKAISNKWFSIHCIENSVQIPRLGLVVSKRILPKSVDRNFAKRLIRETFRLNSSQFLLVDFVVRLRRDLSRDSSHDARAALLQLLLSVK